MADDADLATTLIENTIAAGIATAKQHKSLVACGRCHFCSSTIARGHLFCDPIDEHDRGCADDWQHLQDRRRAQGQ